MIFDSHCATIPWLYRNVGIETLRTDNSFRLILLLFLFFGLLILAIVFFFLLCNELQTECWFVIDIKSLLIVEPLILVLAIFVFVLQKSRKIDRIKIVRLFLHLKIVGFFAYYPKYPKVINKSNA